MDLKLHALSWFPFPSWSFLSSNLYQLHNKYVYTSLFLPPDWVPLEGRNNWKLRTQETYFMTDWALYMYPSQGADSMYKATVHGQIEELSPAAKCQWILLMCGFWALARYYYDVSKVWKAQCVAIYLHNSHRKKIPILVAQVLQICSLSFSSNLGAKALALFICYKEGSRPRGRSSSCSLLRKGLSYKWG